MIKRSRALFACAALLFMVVAVRAQSNTLQGRVVLPNGNPPLNSVKVTLTFNGRRMNETFTDLSGRFFFSGLGKGIYYLTADGDGETFETTTVNAEVTALGSAPQTFTQNIQLRLKPGKSLPAAGIVSIDTAVPDVARKAYEKGAKKAGDNKPEEAIKLLQESILAHPTFYAAQILIGEQYGKLQRYDEAVAAYQKAIELKSDVADGHVGLGITFVKQKKYTEAITPLRRGIELNKQSPTPYLFLGLAEMFTGDFAPAETDLLRAYDIGKAPIVHLYLANLYELKGEPAKAVERLKAFLKETPNMNEARQADIRQAIDKLQKKVSGKN